MSSSEGNAERTAAKKALKKKWRTENPEKQAQYRAGWRTANVEHVKAYAAEYKKANQERLKAARPEAERRARERAAVKAGQRAAARVRARAWAAAHPQRMAERRARFQRDNPERVRKYQQDYYRRHVGRSKDQTRAWRAANPEKAAELSRTWREANRQHLTETQRLRRADPEYRAKELLDSRDRRRLQRRLAKAGLPPPQTMRTPVTIREANDSSATAFFRQMRGSAGRRRIKESYVPTPPELLRQWKQRSLLAQRRFDAAQRYGPALKKYTERHGEMVRAEVVMDSRARQLKGEEALDIEVEVRRRAIDHVRQKFAELSYFDALQATPQELLPSTAPTPPRERPAGPQASRPQAASPQAPGPQGGADGGQMGYGISF